MNTITIKSNCADVTLDGSETGIKFESDYRYIWLENNSSSEIKISRSPNITDQEDGYITRPSGSSFGMEVSNSTIYVLGNGLINIIGTNSDNNPFKQAGKGGDITCTQHITDSLVMQYNTKDYVGKIETSSVAQHTYELPNTIEICGYYTEVPYNSRWFDVVNSEDKYLFTLNQYGKAVELRINTKWAFENGDLPENIIVEPYEKVTFSVAFSSQSVKFYKNGVLLVTRDNFPEFSYADYWQLCFLIGSGHGLSSRLNGYLYDVRIYSRELTANEILQNVEADKKLYFKEV